MKIIVYISVLRREIVRSFCIQSCQTDPRRSTPFVALLCGVTLYYYYYYYYY